MSRRVLLLVAIVWLAVGGYGVGSYASDYYAYRGFGAPRHPPGVASGRLIRLPVQSAALGGRRFYDVYEPAGYAAAKARGQRFGVLYLLHGSPGSPRLFLNAGALGVALDTLVAQHRIPPILVVMPDGRDGTLRSDTEWADTRHGRYESFVLDVVRSADRSLPTLADRRHRVIAGNSEGAYAAANIALRHLDTFAAFEAWSGYFTQTPTGVFKRQPASALRANSPAAYVAGLRAALLRAPLRANLYGGAQDRDTTQLAPFAAALRGAGASVTARVLPGRHDWRLWRSQTPAMLRWAAAAMRAKR